MAILKTTADWYEVPVTIYSHWSPGDPSVGIMPGPVVDRVELDADALAFINEHYADSIQEAVMEEWDA